MQYIVVPAETYISQTRSYSLQDEHLRASTYVLQQGDLFVEELKGLIYAGNSK